MTNIKTQLDAGAFLQIGNSENSHIATATRTGADYIFSGVTGGHRLAADASDAARVEAHWTSFAAACVTENDTRTAANARRIEQERTISKQVVADALAAGYSISVNDGEQTTLVKSTSKADIVAAMFSTDGDWLIVYHGDGNRLGSIMLIYGNGTDVISDYTDKPEIEAVIKRANETADKLAG